MTAPLPTEYPSYFERYIHLVKDKQILPLLANQPNDVLALIASIPAEKENYAYADKKWTIKQVISHMTDTERIMAYRALRFARKDKTPLPGFDENIFVANTNLSAVTLNELGEELKLVRAANIALFNQFDESTLKEIGNSNGQDLSVKALLFIIAGHTIHHLNVIKEKYLVNLT